MASVRSILVVDDNEADLYIAERVLKRSGRYTHILTARDAAETLERFRRYEEESARYPGVFPPLLMLLDINMPRLGGFEFLEELSTLELPEMPTVIVMLTSSDSDADQARARKFDAVQDFITKPLRIERAVELAEKFGQ